jgi:His-Xaa-Ser system protein HxsD
LNAGVVKGASGDYELSVSLKLYSLEAVKKTAYKFTDRFGVFLSSPEDDDGKVVVTFNNENESVRENFDLVYDEFCNELLDQDLRGTVVEKTEGVRNLILAQAFSKTSLLDSDPA